MQPVWGMSCLLKSRGHHSPLEYGEVFSVFLVIFHFHSLPSMPKFRYFPECQSAVVLGHRWLLKSQGSLECCDTLLIPYSLCLVSSTVFVFLDTQSVIFWDVYSVMGSIKAWCAALISLQGLAQTEMPSCNWGNWGPWRGTCMTRSLIVSFSTEKQPWGALTGSGLWGGGFFFGGGCILSPHDVSLIETVITHCRVKNHYPPTKQ